jgi:hypothetical protein
MFWLDAITRGCLHTSCALDLQNALLPTVLLERADERGSYSENSPLTVRGRAGLRTRWSRRVHNVLVAPGDVRAIAGCVERGHGGGGEASVGEEA